MLAGKGSFREETKTRSTAGFDCARKDGLERDRNPHDITRPYRPAPQRTLVSGGARSSARGRPPRSTGRGDPPNRWPWPLLPRLSEKLIVIVVSHASQVEPLMADLASLTSGRPLLFPALEDAGRHDGVISIPHRESYGRRLQSLKILRGPDQPRIVVATIGSLLQPLPSVEKVYRHSRTIKQGATIDATNSPDGSSSGLASPRGRRTPW